MITCGKTLRKIDKEAIVKVVVESNGFDARVKACKDAIEKIVHEWTVSRCIELFGCTKKGAIALLECDDDLHCSSCIAYEEGEGTDCWRDTGEYVPRVLTEFKTSYKTMMKATPELVGLLKSVKYLRDAKCKAENDTTALLSNISSTKMLLEQFPDFAKFVCIGGPGGTGETSLISLETVASVKKLLVEGVTVAEGNDGKKA